VLTNGRFFVTKVLYGFVLYLSNNELSLLFLQQFFIT